MIIYTNQRSSKGKKITRGGRSRKKLKGLAENWQDLSVKDSSVSASNSIPGNGFKKSVDDYRWKKGREETPETIKETERKKSRVAPAYNKGPAMYITEDADITSLGRKV